MKLNLDSIYRKGEKGNDKMLSLDQLIKNWQGGKATVRKGIGVLFQY